MRVLDSTQSAQELARMLGKPILLLSGIEWYDLRETDVDDPTEYEAWQALGGPLFRDQRGVVRLLAVPYLSSELHTAEDIEEAARVVPPALPALPMPSGNTCLIVCETREEMERLYDLTYGDEGLTTSGISARQREEWPEYRGAHRVYALTIGADGRLGTENT